MTFDITYHPVFCNVRKTLKEMHVIFASDYKHKMFFLMIPADKNKCKSNLQKFLRKKEARKQTLEQKCFHEQYCWESHTDIGDCYYLIVQMAFCGMKCVNLSNETVEILGLHFSYNENLEQDKKIFDHIVKIENILKLWRMRQLTLKGRITVFKSLGISKVIHLLLITKIQNNTIDIMYKI